MVIDTAQPLGSLWSSGEDRQRMRVVRREVESLLEAPWGCWRDLSEVRGDEKDELDFYWIYLAKLGVCGRSEGRAQYRDDCCSQKEDDRPCDPQRDLGKARIPWAKRCVYKMKLQRWPCKTWQAAAFILPSVGGPWSVFRGYRGTMENTCPTLHFNTINLGVKWPAGDRRITIS